MSKHTAVSSQANDYFLRGSNTKPHRTLALYSVCTPALIRMNPL